MSGCVTSGQPLNANRVDQGTVDICYTRATHTQCFRESAEAYAEQVEMYRQRLEMAELERSEDW
jgi:hypothetical protein